MQRACLSFTQRAVVNGGDQEISCTWVKVFTSGQVCKSFLHLGGVKLPPTPSNMEINPSNVLAVEETASEHEFVPVEHFGDHAQMFQNLIVSTLSSKLL